jgi:hypothetical protein
MIWNCQRNENFEVIAYGHNLNDGHIITSTPGVAIRGTGETIYRRHPPSRMTIQDLDRYAIAQANDIEKRKLVCHLTIDGDPTIGIGDPVTVQEYNPGDLMGLANQNMYVSGINHRFHMSEWGTSTSDGFHTDLTLVLDLTSADTSD